METHFNTNNELQKLSFHYDDLDFFEQLKIMVDTINERAEKNLLSATYESKTDKESLYLNIKGNNSIYIKRNSILKVNIDDFTIDIITSQGLTIIIWFADYTVSILNKNIDIDINTKL